MKKGLLMIVLSLTFFNVNGQDTGVTIGGRVGLPLGDAGDISQVSLGLDVSYLYDLSDQLKVGVATGYDLFVTKNIEIFGEKIKVDNISFLPVAATAKFDFTDQIFVGLDLGYAVALTDGVDGGMLYQPRIGTAFSQFNAFLYYRGISIKNELLNTRTNLSTIGLGVSYSL